jgi:hypothetical protein
VIPDFDITDEALKGICPGCPHFKSCKVPCSPVAKFLYEKGEPWEKKAKGHNGQDITVSYPLHKQLPMSACLAESKDGKDSPNDEEKLLSDELGSPFSSFNPGLIRTGIFIGRFFNRQSFKELSIIYDMPPSHVRSHYSQAVKVLMKCLSILDQDERKNIADKHYKKAARNLSKNMPKNQRWYLMSRVFGLTPKEIAEIDGDTTNRNVSSAICRVERRLKSGDINLSLKSMLSVLFVTL